MKCSVLSSGSKANSTYIETQNTSILIDCGLSCKKCEIALRNIGVDPQKLDAIFVTHSHHDHIKGISLFSKKFHVPVYGTYETLKCIKEPYEPTLINEFSTYKVKDLCISTAPTFHDALDSLSFKISSKGQTIGYLTDVGVTTDILEDFFKDVSMMILEFNHDPIMLQISDYPYHLKKRIASSYGHLSNLQAGEFLKKIYHENLKALFLAHISENTNTKECAFNEAMKVLNQIDPNTKCYVEALGYIPTNLYDISKDFNNKNLNKLSINESLNFGSNSSLTKKENTEYEIAI